MRHATPFTGMVRVLSVLVSCSVLAGAAAAAHGAIMTVPVVINGRHVVVPRGMQVGDLVRRYSQAAPGDLVAASDRRVIRAGAGTPVRTVVDGDLAQATDIVSPRATVWTVPGSDVVEPVITETMTVDVPPREIGQGPVTTVIEPGRVGIEVRTVGAISHDVVTTQTVAVAAPGLVRRAPEAGGRVIALTFDDGPWPRQTETILAILAEKSVPATFFMLGSRVSRMPEVARSVVEAGHEVGNHTWWHPQLDTVADRRVAREIEGTNIAIQRATGVRPQWFRPPGGRLDARTRTELDRQGMRAALWTIDPRDWREGVTAAEIVTGVTAAARPGAIVVLHDGGGDQGETIAALPVLIDALRAQGYEFVTLDEMTGVRASW